MTRPILSVLVAILMSCAKRDDPPETVLAAAPNPSVHVMTLPEPPYDLPEAAGKDLALGFCVTCHSGRYITDQPRLARKTWTAEVDKMIKTYGAPIPPEKTAALVDYLVAANGHED